MVPVDYQSGSDYAIETPISKLARLLFCEERLADLEGRHEDALKALLDRARLAEHITRGGTELEWVIADTIRPFRPHDGAVALINELDAASCRRFVRDLQQVDANREPMEQIQRRTYVQRAHHSNWESRAGQVINELARDTSHEDYLRGAYKLSQADS